MVHWQHEAEQQQQQQAEEHQTKHKQNGRFEHEPEVASNKDDSQSDCNVSDSDKEELLEGGLVLPAQTQDKKVEIVSSENAENKQVNGNLESDTDSGKENKSPGHNKKNKSPGHNKKDKSDVSPPSKAFKKLNITNSKPRRKSEKGNKKCEDINDTKDTVSVKDFSYLKLVGKGAFGDVFLVRKRSGCDAEKLYALKVVYKAKIKEDINYVLHFQSERESLAIVRDGPFLSTLYYAFQTLSHLFLVMDYNSGGQLLNQFIGQNVLFEQQMRIYMAELLVAVDYLHQKNIIHRDIKPENILLDCQGHIVLIDYGLSKHEMDAPNKSYVGTEPYIAPEILLKQPHDRMADFWSLGVLGFEMVAGRPPFNLDQDDKHLRKAVLTWDVRFPKQFHKVCRNFLEGLLKKDPKQRLGSVSAKTTNKAAAGMKVIMSHKFFKFIDWKLAATRGLQPPMVPKPDEPLRGKMVAFKEPPDTGFRRHFNNYSYSWLQDATPKES